MKRPFIASRPVARLAALLVLVASPAQLVGQEQPPAYAIVVMAHGGTSAWNEQVRAAIDAIDPEVPLEIAFGMADRASLAAAVFSLEEQGARNIAIVRLFVSGDSFLPQTEYLLGLDVNVPDFLFDSSRVGGMRPVPDPGAVPPIEHNSVISLSAAGLVDDEFTGKILAERALELSTDAASETVLVIAHGMGDEAHNSRLLHALRARAASIVEAAPFRAVEVVTLREDWQEDRALAEAEIHEVVTHGSTMGRVIVIPFRVAGFGPYAEVLEGFEYTATGTGLLPHAGMGEWILNTGRRMACAEGWTTQHCEQRRDRR